MSARTGALVLIFSVICGAASAQQNQGNQNNQQPVYGAPANPPVKLRHAPNRPPEPKLVPAPAPDATLVEPKINKAFDIDKLSTGWGWCRYIDDTTKTAYYSQVFPGNPNDDASPRLKGFADFLNHVYPALQNRADYLGADGAGVCTWQQYDSDYVQLDQQKANAFGMILQNYTVIQTTWQP